MWGRELWGWGLVLDIDNNYNICGQHSLKVTHLLSLVVVLTQQCSPSGLLCKGPRDRIWPPLGLTDSWSPIAVSPSAGTVVPSGNCHTTLLVFVLKQIQGRVIPGAPDPISENEMISPVWSMPCSLDAASRSTQCMLVIIS